MFGSEKGVSIIWVIAMAVLFLVSIFFAYASIQDVAKLKEDLAQKDREYAKLDKTYKERCDAYTALAKKVGWKEDIGDVNVNALTASIVDIKSKKMPDFVPQKEPTLQELVADMAQAYDSLTTQLSDRESELRTARDNEAKAESDMTSQVAAKDQEIAQLRRDVQVKEDEKTQEHERDYQEISSLRNQRTTLEDDMKTFRETSKKDKNRLENQILRYKRDVQELTKKQKYIRERDLPDGKVLDISEKTKLGFIDVGLKDGIKKGMKFKVFEEGKGGEKHLKGWIKVVDTQKDISKFSVVNLESSFNPIVAGDFIASDLYDRQKQVVFVFLGVLPGRYNKEEASRLLTEMGVRVDSKVTPDTDFLVVGDKEAGEDSPELDTLPDFTLAQQYSVQMLTPNDLKAYLDK